jgi:hypothetical protein
MGIRHQGYLEDRDFMYLFSIIDFNSGHAVGWSVFYDIDAEWNCYTIE